ncbi:D-alanine--D-alanine ligase [Paracrocinitomix mangrovi]|uniref:D-alanine--D-alanine ligase n=1 Tax=Paracrocinitomix mangrovi TaxID=2862509 RepID=UPI001C8D52E7|nr:D-alanine--D-alanine ligase [Paracrocinitomix mangrovi]UKN03520.1 D-alanine--D-alanine ligase [Paracrocinitomix mangrovi]
MKRKVAVVYGGYSSEANVSQKSAGTIFEQLDKELFQPFLVEISRSSWHVHYQGGVFPIDKNKFTFMMDDEVVGFDLAYIIIHGTPGEDGKLQAYFDMIGLPYANSNCFAAALTFNKWACNGFLSGFGINTAKAILLRKGDTPNPIEIADELGFPCFVKPNDGGSSYGVSKVKTLMEMPDAIAKAFSEGEEVVIESFIGGREVTCGVYYNGKDIVPLPITELIPEGEYFDYDAKYEGKSQEITPAQIPDDWAKKVHDTSKRIYRKLGLRGISRIDYIITPEGDVFLLEVNTNPGFSPASIVPQQIRAEGKEVKNVLTNVINSIIQ